jgi:hypothetical protein
MLEFWRRSVHRYVPYIAGMISHKREACTVYKQIHKYNYIWRIKKEISCSKDPPDKPIVVQSVIVYYRIQNGPPLTTVLLQENKFPTLHVVSLTFVLILSSNISFKSYQSALLFRVSVHINAILSSGLVQLIGIIFAKLYHEYSKTFITYATYIGILVRKPLRKR